MLEVTEIQSSASGGKDTREKTNAIQETLGAQRWPEAELEQLGRFSGDLGVPGPGWAPGSRSVGP